MIRNTVLRLARLLLAAAFLCSYTATLMADEQPYYGFYPSEKRTNQKKFVHNIFGFKVDMPVNWTFGVNGSAPNAVVILYPEGQNTAAFTDTYESIELGDLSSIANDLDQAVSNVMAGMRQKHNSLSAVSAITSEQVNGVASKAWSFTWKSKSGFNVVQYVTLLQTKYGIRSIAMITTRSDHSARRQLHQDIVASYRAQAPKYR